MKYIVNFYDTKGTLKFKREISIASMNKSFKDVDTFFFMAEDYGRIGYEEQDFDNYESDTEIYFQGTLANCKEFDRWCKKEGLYEKGLNGENYLDEETKNEKKFIINENIGLSGEKKEFNLSVKIVDSPKDHGFKNIKQARTWAKENIKGVFSNVSISGNVIEKFLSCSSTSKSVDLNKHFSALKVLPELLNNSYDAEQHFDFKKDAQGNRDPKNGINESIIIHRLFSALRIDGVVYRVKITIKENLIENKKTSHNYEVCEISLPNGQNAKSVDFPRNFGNEISIAILLNNVEKSYENGEFILDDIKKSSDTLGHIYYEPEEIPSGLGGFDNPTEFQTQEMHLLAIKKIGDFGEKIGGSAKDRFNGRTKKEGEPKKVGFNRLPTQEEIEASNGDVFFKKYKPNVSDFEALGLNKICARLAFCHYYGFYDDWAGYNKNSIEELYKFADDKGLQSHWSDFVIEYKRDLFGLSRKSFSTSNVNLYKIDFIYTILGMALEKDLGEDFDWMNVVRINKRGNKHWHSYRDYYIFQSKYDDDSKVSEETRHKVFRLEYEAVENGEPVYRVMYSSAEVGYVFGKQDAFTENKRTYRFDRSKTIMIDDDNTHDIGWYSLYRRYDELYIKGKEKYIEKFGEEKKEDKWRFLDKEGMVAQYRTGKDWRNGKNAEPKDFLDTFGFRAVEFGESMSQKERWRHLNFAYDSFMDLSEILNIKPENISLGGSLGLCFGSRGKGGRHAPMAHYEPVKKVINLTRKMGAGCLAHEWFHAFDNQAVSDGRNNSYATTTDHNSISDYSSKDVYDLFKFLQSKTENYGFEVLSFFECALRLDRYENRSKRYWSLTIECCARAFEWYIKKKLDDKKQLNEYLVQIPTMEEGRNEYYPYPSTENDCKRIEYIYDQIFSLVKQFDGQRGYKTIR